MRSTHKPTPRRAVRLPEICAERAQQNSELIAD
jgi:hypothetical protein